MGHILDPAPPAVAPPAAVRHNLPAERTRLIGRARERAVVAQALADGRLVTLTGVGGGGKTRLALAVATDLAAHFPDGAWLVELAPIADPALVPEAVAAALGLQLPADAALEALLLSYLRPRHLLLVLDNCEHLIDACAMFATRALAAAAGLRILATSREPLRVAGEQQHRLSPLAVPDPDALPPLAELARVPAVRLFLERARAADQDFALTTENAAAVAGVCTRLDGLPLALELAAARVGALAMEQILRRLNDSIRLLTGGNRAGPTRQQTLRAALAWGDALLSPGERALFRRLAVFAGGWDLEAAEAVGAGDGLDPLDVLDLLAQLVDKSLVLAETGPGEARYRMLEPVRQFAAAQLGAQGERDSVRARHAAHYAALAERAAPELSGPQPARWLARLTREMDNLRAALAWADECGAPGFRLRLATSLVPFWEFRSDLLDGRGRLTAALAASPAGTVEARLRVRALLGAARLDFLTLEYADASARLVEALEGARALEDPSLIAAALGELGAVRCFQRDSAGAERYLTEALTRLRALGDHAGEALALLNLGTDARMNGDVARATALLTESLAIFEGEGNVRFIPVLRTALGTVAAQEGEYARAVAHLVASLAAYPSLGSRGFVVWNLIGLAQALFAHGRRGEAARLLGAAEALGELAGAELVKVGRANFGSFLDEVEPYRSEPPFATAWAEGRAMSADRVVAYAQTLTGAAPAVEPPARAATPAMPARHTPAHVTPTGETLTRREHEVALLVARGRSDREIAAALSISPATVGTHVHNILAKLDLRSRHQVATWAVAQGIAPPSE